MNRRKWSNEEKVTIVLEIVKREELLNREIFTTLEEARVLIEQWRREYNQLRPHSALGYRPPAPETILITT